MSVRQICSAIAAAAFASGALSADPAYAQRRDGSLLPQETRGDVVVAGCLLHGSDVRGGHKDRYVIADIKRGPVASVTQAACTADPGADAIELDHGVKGTVSDSMVGRWVEISGSLEKETSKNPDNLRELDVVSIKEIPVVIPRAAAPPAPPPPTPAVEAPIARAPEPEPEPQPVATSGQAPAPEPELPKTASPLPLLGLLGLLSLAGGLALSRRRI